MGRDLTSRVHAVWDEVNGSPTGRAVCVGIPTLAALSTRNPLARAALGALAATSAMREHLHAVARAEREARNAGDTAVLASILGKHLVPPGAWTVESDFALLLANEVRREAETIVECGSGLTTLLLATMLRANRKGRLYSIEHDPLFAEETRRRLAAAELSDWVELIVAPLEEGTFGSERVVWYSSPAIAEIPAGIDLLVVDGPPDVRPWARWPAVEVFHERFSQKGTVLLDDGHRPAETRAALRWQADHPDLDVFWHDTVKGSWRLSPAQGGATDVLGVAIRRLRQRVNVHPVGSGRWPVQRG